MRILRMIGGSLFKAVALLVGVSVLAFALMSASPIDPVQAYVGSDVTVSPEQRENIAAYWGLNDPPVQRYINWAKSLLRGDFGTSMIYRTNVLDVIVEKFSASLLLMGAAWVLSGLIGFGLGVLAGMFRGSFADKAIKTFSLVLSASPTFWIGLLMIMVFAVSLGWFPVALGVPAGTLAQDVTLGARLSHLVLPALTLSIAGIPNMVLHTRAKLCDVLESDYVLYAKSRGESRGSILRRHGLRNIFLPSITLQFAAFAELFGGSVLAEQVFSYPGLGQATVQAGLRGDLPLLMGITLFSAMFVFAGNLIANVLYGLIDPRMRERAVKTA